MGMKQVCIVLGIYYSKEIGRGFPRTKSAEDKTQISPDKRRRGHERWS